MAEEKGVAYILGIVSIVLAFFQPLAAVIFGIIGLVQNRKEKSKKAKFLNIIGIIIGSIFFILSIIALVYGLLNAGVNFPTY